MKKEEQYISPELETIEFAPVTRILIDSNTETGEHDPNPITP